MLNNDAFFSLKIRSISGMIVTMNPKHANTGFIKTVTVNASMEKVWHAFTTSDGASTFFSPKVHIELRPGGPYEIYFDYDAPLGLKGSEGYNILGYIPQQLLCFTWNAPPQFMEIRCERTVVILRFISVSPGKTTVELTHVGWQNHDRWSEVYHYFDRAWNYVLANLKQRFETGPLWPKSTNSKPSIRTKLSHYIYYLHPANPSFFETPSQEEIHWVSQHAGYIQKLLARNIVVFAGPGYDPSFPPEGKQAVPLNSPPLGIVVFKAENHTEAQTIFNGDPAIQAGVFKGRLSQFNLTFARKMLV